MTPTTAAPSVARTRCRHCRTWSASRIRHRHNTRSASQERCHRRYCETSLVAWYFRRHRCCDPAFAPPIHGRRALSGTPPSHPSNRSTPQIPRKKRAIEPLRSASAVHLSILRFGKALGGNPDRRGIVSAPRKTRTASPGTGGRIPAPISSTGVCIGVLTNK